jgi:hypothetical protein
MPRRKIQSQPQLPPAVDEARTTAIEAVFTKHGSPLEALARIAKKAEEDQDYATAVRARAELASYYAPKLRSLEVSGQGGNAVKVELNIDLGNAEPRLINNDSDS